MSYWELWLNLLKFAFGLLVFLLWFPTKFNARRHPYNINAKLIQINLKCFKQSDQKQNQKLLYFLPFYFYMIFLDSDSLIPRTKGVGRHPTKQAMSRWTQYPFVSQSSARYLIAALEHWFRVATVKEAVCLDMLLYTSIGLRLKMSIWLEYQSSMALEKESTNALVAEQLETQGGGCSAAKDETLMMADLFYLLSMCGIAQFDISTQGMQLIVISFMSLWSGISWVQPMLDIPTLFTKIDRFSRIPLFFSCWKITLKNIYVELLAKSATTYSVLILFSFLYLIFANALFIFYSFRAIIHTLNPKSANYSQNPKPIPSLPPVTTTQELAPYLSRQFFSGRMILTRTQRSLPIKTAKTMAPMTARKQIKFKVDCSIGNTDIIVNLSCNSEDTKNKNQEN